MPPRRPLSTVWEPRRKEERPMSVHAGAQPYRPTAPDDDSRTGLKLFAIFLGLAVGVLIPVVIWMGASAQDARNDARHAAANGGSSAMATSMPGMDMSSAQGAVATRASPAPRPPTPTR